MEGDLIRRCERLEKDAEHMEAMHRRDQEDIARLGQQIDAVQAATRAQCEAKYAAQINKLHREIDDLCELNAKLRSLCNADKKRVETPQRVKAKVHAPKRPCPQRSSGDLPTYLL